MEERDILNKVLSMNKCQKFIYSLYDYNGKEFFKSDLEKYFGYNTPQQDLRKIMDLLVVIRVLVICGYDRKNPMFKLNLNELKRLIKDCPLYNSNGEYIEKTVFGYKWK